MPYTTGRLIHDADAHVMETADWVIGYADPDVRAQLKPLTLTAVDGDVAKANAAIDEMVRRSHEDPKLLESEEDQIMARKNWKATGAIVREDRPRALDHLGFASQLIFNSFHNGYILRLEHGDAIELAYGAATAHNRALVDFCSVDERLLPTGYVPLADIERAAVATREAIDLGAAALLIPSACPKGHSPSHVGLDPVWAQAQEAGLPIVFHVGGGGRLLSPDYFENGVPRPPDFHGGDENFRSVDYMAIPGPPAQTLATLLFDGVFDRFPALKFGVIEQGAGWMVSWMRNLESAFTAFNRHEERLQRLSMRPSDLVRRQVRATPFPTEDAGWIVDEVGPDICLFSSDYPHVEGGTRPVERFDDSLGDRSEDVKRKFFVENFIDLMGNGMPAAVRAATAA